MSKTKTESKAVPARKPKNEDRIVYNSKGEPTIGYITLVDYGLNYTVDGERKWPTDGLGWNAKRDAWQRDKTADQTPKKVNAITKAAAKQREPEERPRATKTKARGSAKADSLELRFELERVTKNAVRYKELTVKGEKPTSGTVYLQKSVFPDEPPEKLTLTFAW